MNDKMSLAVIGVLGLGLGWLVGPTLSEREEPPAPPPIKHITADDLAMWDAQSMVSNLLLCREEKVRVACAPVIAASGVQTIDSRACREARAAVLGDGIFTKLKDLQSDRPAQRTLAALALNACQSNDSRQEGLAALLQKKLP